MRVVGASSAGSRSSALDGAGTATAPTSTPWSAAPEWIFWRTVATDIPATPSP
ncbi:hypothetical protein ACQPWY_22130 [Pseudonocardia xinjiangensis]|uniref:hypothetical protein n=1 Tax=Pseudonocardia xinjiangensis TaxID=75289 RepID=UPI003D918D36